MKKRHFTNDQMREILTRAMKRQYMELDSISMEDLEKAASDLGISRDALLDGIESWDTEVQDRLENAETRKRKRQGVIMHGIVFVMINTGLLFHNAYFGGDVPMHWVLLGWGIGLIAHILQDWFGWKFDDEWSK